MKIFISWSGSDSRDVAQLLRKYLPCMIQELEPFMSKHDLASGVRWAESLAQELEHASFGIVCLTPRNLREPWILFEAGALTKHVQGRSCCLLLGGLRPADVAGPLAQFQNRVFARDDVFQLIGDINNLLARPLDQRSLDLVLAKWWPDLERDAAAALAHHDSPESAVPKRETADLLEELLLRVRSIQNELESAEMRPTTRVPRGAIRLISEELAEMPSEHRAALEELARTSVYVHLDKHGVEKAFGKDTIEALAEGGFLSFEGSILKVHKLFVEYFTGRKVRA